MRDADWGDVKLNARGYAREPIRLALHLFPRPHFRPILRAELPATAVSWARNERNATAAEKVRLLCAPPCHGLL